MRRRLMVLAVFGCMAALMLALSGVAQAQTVVVGQSFNHNVTTTAGPTESITITDTASAGLRINSATASQGTCSVTASVATCTLGSLLVGQQVTGSVNVTATQTGTQTLTAQTCGSLSGCAPPQQVSITVCPANNPDCNPANEPSPPPPCPPNDPECQPENPPPPPPPPNAAPVITPISPKANSRTSDTTPLIKARIRDGSGELRAAQIKLFVDGKRKPFKYVAGRKDLLSATPKLKRGKHTVRIVATDRLGKSAAKSWGFKIVKRR